MLVADDEDEFLVIASDGLWEVMNSQQVVTVARRSLSDFNDVQKTSEDLMRQVIARPVKKICGSDNPCHHFLLCMIPGFAKK